MKLRLEAGLGSAEGTLTTSGRAGAQIRRALGAEVRQAETARGDGWAHLEFSNPIDAEAFDQSLLRVSPPVEGFSARLQQSDCPGRHAASPAQVPRSRRPNASRRLRTDSARDVSTTVGTRKPWEWDGLWLAHSPWPSLTRSIPASPSSRRTSLRFACGPTLSSPQLGRFRKLVDEYHPRRLDKDGLDPLAALGRLVLEDTVAVSPARDTPVETRVDLSSLPGSAPRPPDRERLEIPTSCGALRIELARAARAPAWFDLAWVQATQIGLEAAADGDSLQVSTTSLAMAAPWPTWRSRRFQRRASEDGCLRPGSTAPRHEQAVTMMLARTADEVAFLPVHRYGAPGEQPRVHFAGMWSTTEASTVRGRRCASRDTSANGTGKGHCCPSMRPLSKIEYVLEDSRENKLLEGSCESIVLAPSTWH